LFYADLQTGLIYVFYLPQFGTQILPNGLTVHGFGEDAEGELYALVTNTSANGTGGVVYKLASLRVTAKLSGIQAIISALTLARLQVTNTLNSRHVLTLR
jgi:hypothetical protein